MALRIAINRELDNLAHFLQNLPLLMAKGATAVVISFHSLEDRLVKRRFLELAKNGAENSARFELLSKKPLTPSEKELERNPRASSAKLRAIKRIQ